MTVMMMMMVMKKKKLMTSILLDRDQSRKKKKKKKQDFPTFGDIASCTYILIYLNYKKNILISYKPEIFIEGDDFSDGKRETHSTELSVTFLGPSTGGMVLEWISHLLGLRRPPPSPF